MGRRNRFGLGSGDVGRSLDLRGEVVVTAAGRCTYELEISEALFRLATECVHLTSNNLRTFATLETIVAAGSARGAEGFPGHAAETIQGHLESIPTHGPIRAELAVDGSTAERIDATRASLATSLGRAISIADTISVLLFDHAVECTAASLMQRLLDDDTSTKPPETQGSTAEPDGKVFPIK